MKKVFVFIAACAAFCSCSDLESARKHRESLKYKKVRAKYVSINNNECIIGRTTVLLDVDTMHRVDDTITYGNYMYVIVD
jgi:hypothetical protein